MYNFKKRICTSIILLMITMSVFATFNTWMGISLISNTETINEANREYYKTYAIPFTPVDLKDLKQINNLGPSLDISLFPYYEIPLGIKISNAFLFPIGLNSQYPFRVVQGDMEYKLKIGLDYAQSYTDKFGLYATFGYEYGLSRISKTNTWNTIKKSDYFEFSDSGLFGEFGLLTAIQNGYFKFGIDYYHSIENPSYSYSLVFSGGYRF